MRALEWLSAWSALWWGLCLALDAAGRLVQAAPAASMAESAGWAWFLALAGAGHCAALAAPGRLRLAWLRAAAVVSAAAAWSFVAVLLARSGLAAAAGAYAGLALLNVTAAWGLWHESDG